MPQPQFKAKTNYSYDTSLFPYNDNVSEKQKQKDEIYGLVKSGKANNLLQLSELTGIVQSTVSGRVNDLIDDGRVKYDEIERVKYNGYSRKKIVVCS